MSRFLDHSADIHWVYFEQVPWPFNWCTYTEFTLSRFLDQLEASGLLSHPGGIPASLFNSTPQHQQQWDFPNVWPPMVRERTTFGGHKHSIDRKEISKRRQLLLPPPLSFKALIYVPSFPPSQSFFSVCNMRVVQAIPTTAKSIVVFIYFCSMLLTQIKTKWDTSREEVFMEGPIEPNMGPSLSDVMLCTLESTNAGFSSFPVRKLLSWEQL